MKRTRIERDWTDARAKCVAEGRCRVCGRKGKVEAGHVIGREHDRPRTLGEAKLWVNPLDVVPLCTTHHRAYDHRKLDLLGVLTVEEQARAVYVAGGMITALRRITGNREVAVTEGASAGL
jgi:predicted restriction endonuclease